MAPMCVMSHFTSHQIPAESRKRYKMLATSPIWEPWEPCAWCRWHHVPSFPSPPESGYTCGCTSSFHVGVPLRFMWVYLFFPCGCISSFNVGVPLLSISTTTWWPREKRINSHHLARQSGGHFASHGERRRWSGRVEKNTCRPGWGVV